MTRSNTTGQNKIDPGGEFSLPKEKKRYRAQQDIPPELVKELSDGIHEAFDKLCLHFSSRLYSFVYTLIHNQEEAKEIVQDTFVDIFEKRDSIDFTKGVKGLLYVSARNKAFSYIRRIKAMERYQSMPDSNIDNVSAYDEIIIEEEEKKIIWATIATMPNTTRQVMEMKYQGKTTKEIAEILGITERAVLYQFKNATKELRQMLRIVLFFVGV